MKPQKILIVSTSFFPQNTPRSFRTTELVKELCRQGHDVSLATYYSPEEHDGIKEEYGFKIINLGTPYQATKSGKSKLSRYWNRIALYLFEYPKINIMFDVARTLKSVSGYDLMISIATPHPTHWGVSRAWNSKQPIAKNWIADCGDPFMGVKYDKIGKAPYFKFLEKGFCRKADYITVPIEDAKDAYYKEFRHKIRVISQGFKFQDAQALLRPYQPNPVPTFAYAGNFIPGRRDIRPILDFLLDTGKDFKFFIYTKKTNFVEPYLERAGDKIQLSSFIPRSELLPKLSEMDFVLNIENGVSEQRPSKLIDYYLIKRPILSVNSSELDQEKFLAFLERDYTQQKLFDDVDQYRIENVCQKFLSLASTTQNSYAEPSQTK